MYQQLANIRETGIPKSLVLSVDLGTSGCKSALVSIDGTVLAWAFEPVALHVKGSSAEQDPHDWWRAFIKTAGTLCADNPELRQHIVAICCSTQGEGTVCVDQSGKALGNAMLWLDMRGAKAIQRRAGGLINIEGYSPIKLLNWLRLTGGAPALSGKDSAGHIAYIRDHEPDRYERTYKFLNVLDYMNLRLTGRFCSTHDSILTTWVTDNRNPSRIRYHDGLLSYLGVDKEKFPELVSATEMLGPILPELAQQLGIPEKTLVVAGGVDTSIVAVGASVQDRASHLYLGTSSWLGAHLPAMKTDISGKIAAVPCAVPNRYLAIAMQTTAGANLSFLRDRILFHPDEFLSDEERPDVYETLNKIAARVPAGANGLIYMPWLFGERTPVDDPSLRAGLFNLSLSHTREDIIRAFMEGVAFNTRWMMEPFSKLIGGEPGEIIAVGGGAQSDLWCQIMADISGQSIRQLANPIQANAIGAAYVAGVGIGELHFEDLQQLQKSRRVYEPSVDLHRMYSDRFGVFKELWQRLAPVYQRINPTHTGASHART